MNTHTKAKSQGQQTPSSHQMRMYSSKPAQRLTPGQIAKVEEAVGKEIVRHRPQKSAFAETDESEGLCA